MLVDLHIHSALSPCGCMAIGDILTAARERGLDGVCITDHQTMAVRHLLSEGIQANGVCVIFGMEYSTARGDFLVFGPFEDLQRDLEAGELLRTVQNQDGIAIAAHPLRASRPVDEQIVRDGLCRVIECVNGRNTHQENRAADRLCRRYGLTACGGSDAHTMDELGSVATCLHVPVRTRREFIEALKNRLCHPEVRTDRIGRLDSSACCRPASAALGAPGL